MHTSRMVELFADKYVIYEINDIRLLHLREALEFFREWYKETLIAKSNKRVHIGKIMVGLEFSDTGILSVGACKIAASS